MLICCVFALTACGESEKKLLIDVDNQYEVETIQSVSTEIVDLIKGWSISGRSADINDYRPWEINEDYKVIITGADSYNNAQEELGTITDIGLNSPDKWVVTEDKIIVEYAIQGSNLNSEGLARTANIEIIFGKDLMPTSVVTNIDRTMPELMAKAGVNTAMGMGTVFVMLIVISLIISLFQFIPKIQKAFEKKDKDSKVDESVNNTIADIIEREEAEEDDLELVAVIAAAIAASEGASSTDGFVVRSIKRIR